jgi:hypothetical protein
MLDDVRAMPQGFKFVVAKGIVSDIISKDKVAFAKRSKVDMAIKGGFGSFFSCLIVL